jgi:hypothetical protein
MPARSNQHSFHPAPHSNMLRSLLPTPFLPMRRATGHQ